MTDLKKAGLWVPRAFFYEASNPHFSTGIHYFIPIPERQSPRELLFYEMLPPG